MKTLEQQAKEVEATNKSLINRTTTVRLKKKQADIITNNAQRKTMLQVQLQEIEAAEKQLVNFILASVDIEEKDIENVQLQENAIVIIRKPIEKEAAIMTIPKEEKQEDKTPSEIVSEKLAKDPELAGLVEDSNHIAKE